MIIIHHNIDDPTAGPWVRLTRGGVTVSLCRWPSRREVIHSTDGGRFMFDHLEPDADGGPEVVYVWVAA